MDIMKFMKKIFALALIFSTFSAQAESDIDLVLSAGLTFGGETLAETTDGTELTAGGLMYGAIGSGFHINKKQLPHAEVHSTPW